MLIDEETEVEFSSREQLSYEDFAKTTVGLYIDNKFAGDVKVWKDSDMDGREYICLNYVIVYLDTLKKR